MMQKGLSRERPCYKSVPVAMGSYDYNIWQIACNFGVVWALTVDCKLLYRAGISDECCEGTSWEILSAE